MSRTVSCAKSARAAIGLSREIARLFFTCFRFEQRPGSKGVFTRVIGVRLRATGFFLPQLFELASIVAGRSADRGRYSERNSLSHEKPQSDAGYGHGLCHYRDRHGGDEANDQARFREGRNSSFGYRCHEALVRADVDLPLRCDVHRLVPFCFSVGLNETRGTGFSVVLKPYPPEKRDCGTLDTLRSIRGCFGKTRGARRTLDRFYVAEKMEAFVASEPSNPNRKFGFFGTEMLGYRSVTLRSRQRSSSTAYSKGYPDRLRRAEPEQGTIPALRISSLSLPRFRRPDCSDQHVFRENSR